MCKYKGLKTGIIVKSELPLADLINDPKASCAVFIDVKNAKVEVVEEDNESNVDWLELPTLEELYPYSRALESYVADYNIPDGTSSSIFLKSERLFADFQAFRKEMAAQYLEAWLLQHGVLILECGIQDETIETVSPDLGLHTKYTFDRFVVGKCNEEAYKKCLEIANNEYEKDVLVICGEDGLGKEHLLQAVIWHKLNLKQEERIEFIRNELFTREIEKRVSGWKVDAEIVSMINRYQVSELLVISNLDDLINDRIGRYIFEKVIPYRLENKKQILLSCKSLPDAEYDCGVFELLINNAEVTTINSPDWAMREQIVKHYIEAEGTADYFDEETIEKVVSDGNENIRILLGYMYKFIAEKKIANASVEMDRVWSHLSNCIWVYKN